MAKNRVVRLKSRPVGLVTRDDFEIRDEELPELHDGQILVKSQFISLDPAMRGWLSEGKSYVEPVAIGDVMRKRSGVTIETYEVDLADGAKGDVLARTIAPELMPR